MTVAESSILPPKAWLAARFGHHHGSESKHVSRDSTSSTASFLDEPAYLRAVQRRRILEELIDSEENYLGDLKVLTNVSSHLQIYDLLEPSDAVLGIFHITGIRMRPLHACQGTRSR